MKKHLILITIMLITAVGMHAENKHVKVGVRGGYNVTTMSFNKDVLSATNRSGFFIGPTLRLSTFIGIGLDISALYDQREAETDLYTMESGSMDAGDQPLSLKRKTFSIPVNIRYSLLHNDVADIFVFAGPQFDFSLNKDIKKTDFEWSWNSSTYGVNLGAGVTLLRHLEVRFNYNIAAGKSGEFSFDKAVDEAADGVKGKTGAWQIGAAIYF